MTLPKILSVLIAVIVLCSVPLPANAADTPSMLFFYSEDCEHCTAVRQEFLPDFLKRWGDRITFVPLDVASPGVRDSLYALEERLSFPEADKEYPAVYFLGTLLEGEMGVRLRLDKLVEAYLANPDSAWGIEREVQSRPAPVFDPGASGPGPLVHIAYFYKKGCSECSRASEIIDWLSTTFTVVRVDRFDIADRESKLFASTLGVRAGVPENRLMSTPQFFIGDDYILSEDISRQRLADLVRRYVRDGAPAVWNDFTPESLAAAEDLLASRFRSFAIAAIAIAGLADGVNPCAFATILFFVSYLTMVGRRRQEILLVGLGFAGAVFLTYFLVGLGLFKFIRSVSVFDVAAKIIFGGTAVICLVLGILSLFDYRKARAGNTSDMTLQLPRMLKERIHATVRQQARTDRLFIGAVVAGFAVSILEFACTGQVYLPTITFMVGIEGLRTRAMLMLLLYNVCFILPLLAVFGIVYSGISSRRIGAFMEQRVGAVKLLLATVFFAVGILLAWAVFL